MSITIAGYSFDGPYASTDKLEDKSGVYAILDYKDNKYYLIDVGESSEVKSRVENHDRKSCWNKNITGQFRVAVHYTPNKQQAGRKEIEQAIRDSYDGIPCGER